MRDGNVGVLGKDIKLKHLVTWSCKRADKELLEISPNSALSFLAEQLTEPPYNIANRSGMNDV